MADDNEILVDLLRDIFGKEKQHYDSKGQISHNCPNCDEGKNKGNLEINYFKHVFHCWSCGDTDNMHDGNISAGIVVYTSTFGGVLYNPYNGGDKFIKMVWGSDIYEVRIASSGSIISYTLCS